MAACVLAGLLACAGSVAGDRAVPALFKAADGNRDGQLDAAEFRRYLELFFDQDDANRDGYLDRRELALSMARSSGGTLKPDSPQVTAAIAYSFPIMDSDGNGRLSREEAVNFRALTFAATDRDGDGRLSPAEVLAQVPGR